jgi:hypothetical protein
MHFDFLTLASRTTSKNDHDVQVGAREHVLRADFSKYDHRTEKQTSRRLGGKTRM